MNILNLTQHIATQEQIEAGVVEPMHKEGVQKYLTFDTLPTREEIEFRAKELARIAKINGAEHVMIGGAPYLMSALERKLEEYKIACWYSFSERVSTEETLEDGTVKKVNSFKHVGFIDATGDILQLFND